MGCFHNCKWNIKETKNRTRIAPPIKPDEIIVAESDFEDKVPDEPNATENNLSEADELMAKPETVEPMAHESVEIAADENVKR